MNVSNPNLQKAIFGVFLFLFFYLNFGILQDYRHTEEWLNSTGIETTSTNHSTYLNTDLGKLQINPMNYSKDENGDLVYVESGDNVPSESSEWENKDIDGDGLLTQSELYVTLSNEDQGWWLSSNFREDHENMGKIWGLLILIGISQILLFIKVLKK